METRVERTIMVVPDRVMQALTEPDELRRWCCDSAAVDGATYRLSGEAVPLGLIDGRLLERTDRRLAFRWGESTVTVTLSAAAETGNPPAEFTRVEVVHTGIPAGMLPNARAEAESWECVWTLWLRQLKGWLERAEAVDRFNYLAPVPATVERSLLMDAPAGKVWAAITRPDLRSQWLTVDLGQELNRDELRSVTYAFPPGDGRVTWTVRPVGETRTLVTVREDGITHETLDNHLGWHDYLVALCQETARPLLRRTVWIKAAPDKVWRHMASQEALRRWFSANIRFEPRVGAPVAFEAHGGGLSGRVVTFDPGRCLAFTWTEVGVGWPEPEPLLLTLELTPENGGTRVVLTHAGFENLPEAIRMKEFGGYLRGWSSYRSVAVLKQLVEEEERPMIRTLDNVAIPVGDMDKAIGFYQDVLGMSVKESYGPEMTFMAVPGSETAIMLRQRPNPVPGNGYITLVIDDVKARKAELEGKGATVSDGPYPIPGVGMGMDLHDPDGNMLVLIDLSDMQQG